MAPNSDNSTVISVAIAGVVAVAVAPEGWDFSDTIVGLLLLIVLVTYGNFGPETMGSRRERVALSAVVGFCLTLVIGLAVIPKLHDRFCGSESLYFAITCVTTSAGTYFFLPWVAQRWFRH